MRALRSVAVLAAFSLIAVSCGDAGVEDPSETSVSHGSTSVPEDAVAPEMSWFEFLAGGISADGVVSKETALAAFAAAVGGLPGVSIPEIDPPSPFAAGAAVRWTLGHWEDLTTEQRAAVDDYLSPGIGGASSEIGRTVRLGRSGTGGKGLRAQTTVPPEVGDCSELASVQELPSEVAGKVGDLFGTQLVADVYVCPVIKGKGLRSLPRNEFGATTTGQVTRCEVHIDAELWEDRSIMVEALAWGITGCLQAETVGITNWLKAPPWLVEGQMNFARQVLAEGELWSTSAFEGWLDDAKSLFQRTGDASGFFHLIRDASEEERASQALEMLRTWALSGNEAAYDLVATGELLDEWGASKYLQQTWGDAWWLSQNIFDSRKDEASMVLRNGEVLKPTAPAYVGVFATIDVQADVMVLESVDAPPVLTWTGSAAWRNVEGLGLVETASADLELTYDPGETKHSKSEFVLHGRVRIGDDIDASLPEAAFDAYCFSESCECPVSERTAVNVGNREVNLGLTGHKKRGAVNLHGYSLDEFCSADLPGSVYAFKLTGGTFQWKSDTQKANNGCVWPEVMYEGDVIDSSYDQYLYLDTTQRPYAVDGRIESNAQVKTTIPPCPPKYRDEKTPTRLVHPVWVATGENSQSVFDGSTFSGIAHGFGPREETTTWELASGG